jgi:hypothetical protein
MFEGLVNLLPILKDLAHTPPNVELPEIKKKKKFNLYSAIQKYSGVIDVVIRRQLFKLISTSPGAFSLNNINNYSGKKK